MLRVTSKSGIIWWMVFVPSFQTAEHFQNQPFSFLPEGQNTHSALQRYKKAEVISNT